MGSVVVVDGWQLSRKRCGFTGVSLPLGFVVVSIYLSTMIKIYRVDTARMSGWDYGARGAYFITINVKYRKPVFGEVVGDRMVLSRLGRYAEEAWRATPGIRPDMALQLGAFVVMPDHFHAILVIGDNQFNREHRRSMFGPQSHNLASVVRGFKSSVTSFARREGIPFGWQPRFYDSIIRSRLGYSKVTAYIEKNPAKWSLRKKSGLPPR